MNEAELQAAVIDTAHLLGWHVAHFRPCQNSRGEWMTAVAADGAGFPDLVLVRERLLFVELKVKRNTTSAAQDDWFDWLRTAGADVRLWRDKDWTAGVIEDELRRRG